MAAVCVVSGGALALVVVAGGLLSIGPHGIDDMLLRALRHPADPADPVGPAWLETFFRDVTALGGYPVLTLVVVLATGYLALRRRWDALLVAAPAVVGGVVLNSAVKAVVARPRPELVAHLVEVQTASLPSAHAMASAVAYLTLGALLSEVQPRPSLGHYITATAILLTLLVGFSRVYLGVHYPTDVLAGWSLGAAWAMGCWLVVRHLNRRRSET